MIRMMKHYRTPLADPAVRAHDVSFSSYVMIIFIYMQ
jgi:hypothetical protein